MSRPKTEARAAAELALASYKEAEASLSQRVNALARSEVPWDWRSSVAFPRDVVVSLDDAVTVVAGFYEQGWELVLYLHNTSARIYAGIRGETLRDALTAVVRSPGSPQEHATDSESLQRIVETVRRHLPQND